MRRGLSPALAALILSSPALAGAPLLAPPLDCDPGAACFIQQYVDADPGDGAADFTCGSLSYDGHKGTDFALPSRAKMEDGVDVLASAPGTVRAVRDGMPDIPADDPVAESVEGRECGNGVVIAHGDGWETQYCHMRVGSISVEEGQRVTTGAPLGLVGLSGQTVFPHLHLSVRKNGNVVDPFNPDGNVTCDDPDPQTLWADAPAYVPGGLIAAGFADAVPDYSQVKAGRADQGALTVDADAVVLWAYAFGARAGDVLRLSITGPDGIVIDQDLPLDRTQAQVFRAIGKRRPDDGWAPGSYEGTATLTRDGDALDRMSATAAVE